jgi:hypothetical protein
MRPLRIVTTSWDDGDPNDLRVAEPLHSRGLAGAFYIPIIGCHGGKTLEPADLKSLRLAGPDLLSVKAGDRLRSIYYRRRSVQR